VASGSSSPREKIGLSMQGPVCCFPVSDVSPLQGRESKRWRYWWLNVPDIVSACNYPSSSQKIQNADTQYLWVYLLSHVEGMR
jgi:hypothetical protein